MDKVRVHSLDGLRGIAIILVMGFHYCYALADGPTYPYGDRFARFILFNYGYLGVELFFMISGFAIAMTLENCSTAREFFIRRLSRIWPPLLFFSVMTFLFIRLIPTPFALRADQQLINFIPSWTLTPPDLWRVISPDIRYIDFVYWSLVVEVRFYLFTALLFWLFGRENFGRNLMIFACLDVLGKLLLRFSSPFANDVYLQVMMPPFVSWFAAGAVFYDLYLTRLTRTQAAFYLAPLFLISIRYGLREDLGNSPWVLVCFIGSFFGGFWLMVCRTRIARIFSATPLIAIGARSYSIYLIHFEIGASLISAIPKNIPVIWQSAAVVGVATAVVITGYLSFLSIERYGKRLFLFLLLPHGPPKH